MLFDSFEAYDVQETRRISKAEGKAEGEKQKQCWISWKDLALFQKRCGQLSWRRRNWKN